MRQFKFKHLLVILFHTLILRLIAPFAVGLGVWFAKKAPVPTTHYGQDANIQRYVLPKWLNIFNTPDEHGWPMYEETVAKIYHKYGWRVAMWYNLGLRNQAQGWLWLFGYQVTEQQYKDNKATNYRLFNKFYNLGLFTVSFGWEVAKDHYKSHTTTGYYVIPDIGFGDKGVK